jgi:murein L,D-transpeptidase YcbB/YkuD
MKSLKSLFATGVLLLLVVSCKKNDGQLSTETKDRIAFEPAQIDAFLSKHPEFSNYKPQFDELYQKHHFNYVWYDKDGRVDFAEVLYNRMNQMDADGVTTSIPYKSQIDQIFSDDTKARIDNELLISAMYFFYAQKVLVGVDAKKSKSTGWFLPRDKMDYAAYLDELLRDPDKLETDPSKNISQYYHLKKALQKYRAIKDKGGWATISFPASKKMLRPGDNDPAIAQVRKRLAASGEIASDNGSAEYDPDMQTAIADYRKRNNILGENLTQMLVDHMNVAVEDRIRTIIVNMERCRWISPDIAESKELIAVNIPAYQLRYFRDGKPILESNVVVGKEANKTVVFSGQMSYLVFSPYWNVPKSIVESEIRPDMAKDKNYLEKHNMEWNGENLRQKPGNDNSLGLIKFMFPNSNNIYLHDTPAKNLFGKDDRAQSHGCVRVEKARELAILILDNDKNWTPATIDEAMHAGTEKKYSLNHKIPVYIAYFTAWADENGDAAFYEDVYGRDNRLAHLLYN